MIAADGESMAGIGATTGPATGGGAWSSDRVDRRTGATS